MNQTPFYFLYMMYPLYLIPESENIKGNSLKFNTSRLRLLYNLPTALELHNFV